MSTNGRRRGFPLIKPGLTYATVTDQIAAIVQGGTRRGWLLLLVLFTTLALLFLYTVTWVFVTGVGLLGINIPVAWGFPLVNVVWWIGIGHAGTLISAILVLLRQPWRTSINRFAEAMTIFAAGIAGLFPLIHLGRPGFFYWLLPYPDTMGLWPQWRSPLVWDFFAIATYIFVSLVFWYLGLLPDLAVMRDRAKKYWQKVSFGLLSLGWRNSARHWHHYRVAYLLIAALATPLVVSVHSIIALDFAATIVPGYHTSLFPPYFVAGALFSGFAMVLTLAIPLRSAFKLQNLITLRHFDIMAKVMLAAGLVVAYGYLMEYFMIWYNGDAFHREHARFQTVGEFASVFWTMIICNVAIIQLLWLRRIRLNPPVLFAIAIVVNIGMWLERYLIVFSGPSHTYLPSARDVQTGNAIDWMMFIGSLGLFFMLMLLFIRLLPAVSIHEVKELIHDREAG
ncbi:MAG: NrfD/PsrC family molybdoenzyme membrane anchor subunit [Pseudohongiellaceae bacterium]